MTGAEESRPRQMTDDDRVRWDAALSLSGLAYVMSQWLMQAGVQSRPGRVPGRGPLVDSASPDMLPAVIAACQAQFLVTHYQPRARGVDVAGAEWSTLACAHGFARYPLAVSLQTAGLRAGLEVRMWDGVRRSPFPGQGRAVRLRNGVPEKHLGAHLNRKQITREFAGCNRAAIDALSAAYQITIIDPRGSTIWKTLDLWALAHM